MSAAELTLPTASGAGVRITSDARAHLEAHPTVWRVLREAVARITLPESANVSASEIDLGRPLELATLLPAPALDLDTPASFAVRQNRAHPSRVTEETPTTWESTVVVHVSRATADAPFELATAFIGKLAPLEPWDQRLTSPEALRTALEFWSRHALVYDSSFMGPIITSSWSHILRTAGSPFV
jgi:hypothetical protein